MNKLLDQNSNLKTSQCNAITIQLHTAQTPEVDSELPLQISTTPTTHLQRKLEKKCCIHYRDTSHHSQNNIFPSRLFCELSSFGDIGYRVVCLGLNRVELHGTTYLKNTTTPLYRNHDLVTQDNPQTML